MTRLGIEPRSPGPLANTLTARPMSGSLKEIYLSHFILERVAKGLRVRGKLETQHIDPQFHWLYQHFFSHSAGLLNRGPECPSPLLGASSHWLELQLELQLTDSNSPKTSVPPVYITVWCPPASCERRICTEFNPSTVKVIPWYLRADAPVSWLTAGLKVNMLHQDVYFKRRIMQSDIISNYL